MLNFLPTDGKDYGYFSSCGYRENLERIDPTQDATATSMTGVTVAFFAPDKHPGHSGQVLVEWYSNAWKPR